MTLFRCAGIMLVLPVLAQFAGLIEYLAPPPSDATKSEALVRLVANTHTAFNLLLALLFLPFLNEIANVIEMLVPGDGKPPSKRSTPRQRST